jgi:hypothetical protein
VGREGEEAMMMGLLLVMFQGLWFLSQIEKDKVLFCRQFEKKKKECGFFFFEDNYYEFLNGVFISRVLNSFMLCWVA